MIKMVEEEKVDKEMTLIKHTFEEWIKWMLAQSLEDRKLKKIPFTCLIFYLMMHYIIICADISCGLSVLYSQDFKFMHFY